MNQEKILFFLLIFFAGYSVINLKIREQEPREFEISRIQRGVDLNEDFDISSVLDDTPLTGYFDPAKRNPFVPVWHPENEKIDSEPTVVEKLKDKFKFPWSRDKDKKKVDNSEPEKKTEEKTEKRIFKESQITQITIPPKPGQKPSKPAKKITKDKAKKDKSIPVYLIGFVKVGTGSEKSPRKALIAHKKTGKVYTVHKGEKLLGLEVTDITPYSIVIKMADGRIVEFLNDILKEAGKHGTGQ